MAEKVESHTANALFDYTGKNLMMDIRGDVYETYEVAPDHVYRTVKALDESYEGALPGDWDIDYNLEFEHVFASLEKNYSADPKTGNRNPVSIDPSHKVMVCPVTEDNLELEISGVLDISPDDFLALLN